MYQVVCVCVCDGEQAAASVTASCSAGPDPTDQNVLSHSILPFITFSQSLPPSPPLAKVFHLTLSSVLSVYVQ